MPRLLSILNRLNIGGPARVVGTLHQHLPASYEARLLAGTCASGEASAAQQLADLGVEATVLPQLQRPIHPLADLWAYQRLKQEILDFQPHIVHTHAAKAGFLGRMAARACGVPVVVHTFHGHVFHAYFSASRTRVFLELERYAARRTDALIALSPGQLSELVHRYRIAPAERFRMIPIGLDLEPFGVDRASRRQQFRNLYQIQPDEVVLGYVGRLAPVKSVDMLVRVVHLLIQQGLRVRLFIVGDGVLFDDLLQRVRQLDLTVSTPEAPRKTAQVYFLSWVQDVATLYPGFDVVCLTSRNEGTPVSAIEAMASGCPVVATDAGGTRDVVAAGETGFVVPVSEESAFADAVRQLYGNPELRQRMGQAGRLRVDALFSVKALLSNTLALYDTLLFNQTGKSLELI